MQSWDWITWHVRIYVKTFRKHRIYWTLNKHQLTNEFLVRPVFSFGRGYFLPSRTPWSLDFMAGNRWCSLCDSLCISFFHKEVILNRHNHNYASLSIRWADMFHFNPWTMYIVGNCVLLKWTRYIIRKADCVPSFDA